MDTVTYPHELVQNECQEHWLTIKIDVDQRSDVAAMCGIHGIPAVVAVDGSGKVLGTVLGYVEPKQFAKQLLQLRTR
ncbi:MAG TPA: thioredoxin [Planctomycetes bacterium]|nr:thioredoxin [Planctomycetota bacterium]